MSKYKTNIRVHIAQLILGLYIAGGLVYFAITYAKTGFMDFSLPFIYLKRWTNSFPLYVVAYIIQVLCIFEYVKYLKQNIENVKVDIVSLTPFIFFFASIIYQTTYILVKVILI